jgi:hypothetical protein
MEKFLSSISDLSFFKSKGVKIVNQFPDLPRIIEKYHSRLEKAKDSNPFDEITVPKSANEAKTLLNKYWNSQYYEQKIDLPVGNDFYTVRWSVPKAQEVIKTYNIGEIKFFTNVVSEGVTKDTINQNFLETAYKNEDPIIVVRYPLLSTRTQLLVIDGNHRVISRSEKGEQYTKGYLLDTKFQEKALAGEMDRVLYRIHYNIGMIVNYLMGEFTKTKMKSSFLDV